MNTPKITQNNHPLDGGDYVLGESDNPFARIACKTRKLTPTVCDGTCLNCRKERDIFFCTEVQKRINRESLTAGGDPDYAYLSPEEHAIRLRESLEKIGSIKQGIIQHRNSNYILAGKVAERIRITALRIQSPNCGTTLQ